MTGKRRLRHYFNLLILYHLTTGMWIRMWVRRHPWSHITHNLSSRLSAVSFLVLSSKIKQTFHFRMANNFKTSTSTHTCYASHTLLHHVFLYTFSHSIEIHHTLSDIATADWMNIHKNALEIYIILSLWRMKKKI